MKKFFCYDPEGEGLFISDTKEEAKEFFKETLQLIREAGIREKDDEVCWGKLIIKEKINFIGGRNGFYVGSKEEPE